MLPNIILQFSNKLLDLVLASFYNSIIGIIIPPAALGHVNLLLDSSLSYWFCLDLVHYKVKLDKALFYYCQLQWLFPE